MNWLDGVPLDSVRSTREVEGGTNLKATSKGAGARRARNAAAQGSDFDRLESAVAALVAQHERLGKNNHDLQVGTRERDERIRALEGQLLEANQLRQDVAKRIDELIGQIDQLDGQLESVES